MSLITAEYSILFLIITVGILFGELNLKGVSLGNSAVIFVALLFGHLGYQVPAIFQKVGLIFFIYTIGVQAGPGLFEAYQKKGAQLAVVSTVVVVTGAILSIVLAYVFGVDFKMAAGIFTGALTSTPGLASAIESTGSAAASIGYGIAYPFGVIGVILFVRLSPRLFKKGIAQAEEDYKQEMVRSHPEVISRNFVVENESILGQTIGDLEIRSMTGANISRIVHEGEAVVPEAHSVLHKGDLVKAVGTGQAMKKIKLLIGRETEREIPTTGQFDVQWILVTNKKVVNKSLGELNLFNTYNATITRIRRSGIDFTPDASSRIRFGDKLMVAASKGNLPAVTQILGNNVKLLTEADFLPIAAGIVLGILLGMVKIPLPGGIDFTLGLTGGVLVSGLVLSRLGKTGPIIWNVSGPANQVLRQLGLLFFLAAVGTQAGTTLVETISENGVTLLIMGIAITIVPMVVATVIGLYVYNINILSMLGTLAGGMTSTPGLSAVDTLTESNAPAIAYATVYPFAMVLVIICPRIIGVL